MRKLLLFCIFLTALLKAEVSVIDETKVDLYYANGIMLQDSEADSQVKWEENVDDLLIDYPQLQAKLGKTDVAYNISNGMVADMWEAFKQKVDLEPSYAANWNAFKLLVSSVRYVGKAAEFVIAANESASDMLQHDGTLNGQVTKYKESIKAGHSVVVVAHSQGNLFTLEAFKKFEGSDAWMKAYFHTIAVATPGASIPNGGKGVTFYNDMINLVPTAMNNNIGNPNQHDYISVTRNAVGEILDQELLTDQKSIQYHSFEYYLGYPVYEKALKEGSTSLISNEPRQTDNAKTIILAWLYDEIVDHFDNTKRPSQWKVKKTTGCGCDLKVSLTHIEPIANLDYLVTDVNPLAFNETGKLYQVYDETNTTLHWVKGNSNGTAIKNEQDHLPNVCYSLTGTEEVIKGSTNPDPTDGLLRVVLDWDKKDIDLNLGINGPTAGVKEEHPEYECPRENWYIANESALATGDYFVSVTAPSNVDQALMPEKVRIDVKAMGKGEYIGIDINDSALLSLGEVYKIHVEVPAQGGGSASSSINRVTAVPVSTTVPYREDNDGTIYTADLFLLLKQEAMGPIAGASLLLEKLNNGEWQALYTGVTTSGATLNSNGLIIFPASLQENALESDILLLTASGGQDVDADDDLNMDATPTVVLGKLHAFIDAENVAGNNFKVNILTEIAYQVIRNRLDANTTKEALLSMLDGVSKLLLKKDLNEDSIISYSDTTSWLASFDKEKLQFDYNEKIEPIVQKIYIGEDIYLDVYKLLYAGKITSINIDTNETDTICISLNNMTDITQLAKEDFILKDSHSNVVDFIFESTNDELIFYPSTELIGGNEYTIEFSIEIIDAHGNIFLDTHLHKFRIPEWSPPIIPETTIHIAENSLFVPINVIDPSTPLKYTIIGGADKDRFRLNNDKDKLYFKDTPDFEEPIDSNVDNTYELDIRIADSFLNATIQSVLVIVDDVLERPTVKSTYFTIDENATSGTIIGSLELSAIGSPITSIDLSGDGHENFLVDSNGVITVSSVANLDYSIKQKYTLVAQVTNAQGFSDSAEVIIYVTVNKPFLLGSYNTSGYATGVAISTDENIACVADFFSGLQIIDISTPGAPILLGTYHTPSSARDVAISKDNNIAYIASYESGLQIIDISKPTSPHLLGSYDTPGNAGNLVLSPDGNVIYMTDYASGLQIIDVSTPTAPFLLTNYDTYTARSVTISKDGNTLYLADTYRGLYILDVSTPVSPKLITNYYTDSSLLDIALSPDGNTVYMTGSIGVQIVDVSTPQTPYQLSSFTSFYPRGIVISSDGNTAFVSDNERGLQILDVSNLDSPILLWNYNTPGSAQNVTISSDDRTVYISDYTEGLHIIDVSYLTY